MQTYQSFFGYAYPKDAHGYQTYQRESNDCANFVSQAIFAGTSYIDGDVSYWNPTPNDDNWYYVFNPPSDKGSTSWINVAHLKSYLTRANGSRGPYGYDSDNYLCNLHNGDPIMMKASNGLWHTVIVSYIAGDCNVASNILVDAHNTEYKQKPLSFWSGYEWHAVTISGYYK